MVPPRSRALVSSSSVIEATLPSATSAKTHVVDTAMCSELLQNFQLLEELDDALVGLALVFDDLARLARLGGRHVVDGLAGARPADVVVGQSEVGDLDLVDGLVL